MSIKLRLTLLYTGILALILIVFSLTLYNVQAQSTLAENREVLREIAHRVSQSGRIRPPGPPPGESIEDREDRNFDRRDFILYIQIIDPDGNMIDMSDDEQLNLPLSAADWQTLQADEAVFGQVTLDNIPWGVYSIPYLLDDEFQGAIQVARPISERQAFLAGLARFLTIGSSLTVLIAFGVGWVLASYSLRPIHQLTQTAQRIGNARDFSQRVVYAGPNDEISELASTFNRMLNQLEDAYLQVAQSLQVQQRFVADASHELRTPLTTIRGNLELLRREPPITDEDRHEVLADMVDETDRLIRLVKDLLVLARNEGPQSRVLAPVQVSALLEDVYRQGRLLAPARHIHLEHSDNLPDLLADRDTLKQVLLILLDNACKHTPPSAQITLCGQVDIGQVRLSVHDTGLGIPPEKLPHLFERFYRGDTARSEGGTGLGLAIAKMLINAQGGELWVESELGKGSRFSLLLQRA